MRPRLGLNPLAAFILVSVITASSVGALALSSPRLSGESSWCCGGTAQTHNPSGGSFIPLFTATTTFVVGGTTTVTRTYTAGFTITSGGAYTTSNPIPRTSSGTALGIDLRITTNSSTIKAGGTFSLTAYLFNTKSQQNNVSSSDNWAFPDLVIGPCGPTDSPVAFAVVQGDYSSSNISAAPRIQYGFGCTTVMGNVKFYSFQPTSEIASVFAGCNPDPCFTRPMTWTRSINGYWNNNEYSAFTPGMYTILIVDEWGDIAISNFTVNG